MFVNKTYIIKKACCNLISLNYFNYIVVIILSVATEKNIYEVCRDLKLKMPKNIKL